MVVARIPDAGQARWACCLAWPLAVQLACFKVRCDFIQRSCFVDYPVRVGRLKVTMAERNESLLVPLYQMGAPKAHIYRLS